jgi:hypothetical protein
MPRQNPREVVDAARLRGIEPRRQSLARAPTQYREKVLGEIGGGGYRGIHRPKLGEIGALLVAPPFGPAKNDRRHLTGRRAVGLAEGRGRPSGRRRLRPTQLGHEPLDVGERIGEPLRLDPPPEHGRGAATLGPALQEKGLVRGDHPALSVVGAPLAHRRVLVQVAINGAVPDPHRAGDRRIGRTVRVQRPRLLVFRAPAGHAGFGHRRLALPGELRLRVAPFALVDRVGRGRRGGVGLLFSLRLGDQCGGRGREARPFGAKDVFQHVGQVVDQVPAVGDLDRLGRTIAGAFRIGAGAVPGDERDAGMRPQPGGKTAAGAIREEIDGVVTLQVDQDRAVREALVDRPVVDAKHGWHRPRDFGRLAEEPQQRVGTDGHPALGRHPRARLAPERDGEVEERRPLTIGAVGDRRGDPRQALGEDFPGAGGVDAKEPACPDSEADGHARPRQVGQRAGVAAVDSVRRFAAHRTPDVGSLGGGEDRQSRLVEEQGFDVQGPRNGQDGSRGHRDNPPSTSDPPKHRYCPYLRKTPPPGCAGPPARSRLHQLRG